MRLWQFLLNPAPVTEGGGTPTEAPVPAKGPDLSKAAEGLVAKHGVATAALLVLLGENYTLRDKVREASTKLPAEGSVVLAGDDARHWGSYRQLGAPGDLKKALDEGKQQAAEAGSFRKAETVRSAAELHGFKPGVLGTLAKDLEITIGDRTDKDGKPVLKDGQPVKAAFVKGEGEKLVALDDHAKAAWGDFLPSLRTAETTPRGTPRAEGNRTAPPTPATPRRRNPNF